MSRTAKFDVTLHPFVNPRWDARTFDTLMQAERGLTATSVSMPYTEPGVFLEDLRFELLFASNAVQNARSTPADYILWGIWPGMDMIDWETIHDDEHYRHRLRADYLTWKIKQLHPTLPAGWRVWIIPGFELTRRPATSYGTPSARKPTEHNHIMRIERDNGGDEVRRTLVSTRLRPFA